MGNSEFLNSLSIELDDFQLKPCCQQVAIREFFNSPIEELMSSNQKSQVWEKARQFRITGKCSFCFQELKNFEQTLVTQLSLIVLNF